MADPIKKITLADGAVRYRFVVDVGRTPDGKRQQKTFTRDTKREAARERNRILHEVGRGTYVMPTSATVEEVVDAYLAHACRDVEEGTKVNYRAALMPVRERLGPRRVQSLTEADIDRLVDWMLKHGRKRGGQPGTGLSLRTVSLTLGQLRAALNLAVRRKMVVRNVAMDTRIPRAARKEARAKRDARQWWTEDEVRTFLQSEAVSTDRLHPVVLLSLMGLRPAEVCGLRWTDVDFDTGMLSIANTRTLVEGRVIEKDTKSAAGTRTLPLPREAAASLQNLRRLQLRERMAAGPGTYLESGYVLVDELGAPFQTDQFRRRVYRLMADAGMRKVRPYDARHACLTFLARQGVPGTEISAWAGHSDLGLAARTYIHHDPSHLRLASDQLNALFGP